MTGKPEFCGGKPYNEYMKEMMRKYYSSGKGKVSSLAYRLRKKYGNSSEIDSIVNDPELSFDQKLKQLKIFSINQKFN